ncbi:hypothetical protein V6N11_003366 [Hibiscus sabdariffa]|uniref:Uncharacterized protein n=1 Tax=Hibiscus sabdariffa TaxID=183260 RepID=A0ABR2SDN3_9ROSI
MTMAMAMAMEEKGRGGRQWKWCNGGGVGSKGLAVNDVLESHGFVFLCFVWVTTLPGPPSLQLMRFHKDLSACYCAPSHHSLPCIATSPTANVSVSMLLEHII